MRKEKGGTLSATPARRFCRAALRLAAGLALTICLMLALRLFGVPVPGPLELLDKFKSVTQLAETLS